MGTSLYRLHVPTGFGGRVGSNVNTSHVFLQGEPAATTLAGGGPGDGGARKPGNRHSLLLSVQQHFTGVVGPKLLEQKPRGSCLSWLHSLQLWIPLPGKAPSPRSEVLERRGAGAGPQSGLGTGGVDSGYSPQPDSFWRAHFVNPVMAAPRPAQMPLGVWAAFVPHNRTPPQLLQSSL